MYHCVFACRGSPSQAYVYHRMFHILCYIFNTLDVLYYRMCYMPFVAWVLGFIWQLQVDVSEFLETFEEVLAPGPGNWITPGDLSQFEASYYFEESFADPRLTTLAAQIRVVHTFASDCATRRAELEYVQVEQGRLLFPQWHASCYFRLLANMWSAVKHKHHNRHGFQKVGLAAIILIPQKVFGSHTSMTCAFELNA